MMARKKIPAKAAVQFADPEPGEKDRKHPSCGAFALAHACKTLGVAATPEELAADCDDGVDTASMAGLSKAATKRGLTAQPAQWTIQDLKQNGAAVSGRMLMHFPAGGGHWTVFESFDGKTCWLIDPTTVRVKVDLPLEKLGRWWDGKVLVVGKPAAGGRVR
jgi:ABC-type bacteriocin/lantibiotic exporter with double-glycine peptidase domain